MARIGQNATEWIAEDRRGVLECDVVFGQVGRGLLRIPLELQSQPSLYLRSLAFVLKPYPNRSAAASSLSPRTRQIFESRM